MKRLLDSSPSGLRSISTVEQLMSEKVKGFDGISKSTKKSKLLAIVKQAAPTLKVSEKSVYLLDQLMAFSQERDWEPGRKPIVWPSNEMLCDALGIQKRSLQYRLKALRDAGLIVSCYGAQERRYGRRGFDGHIVEAYGFDLSPLAIRQEELQAIADKVREQRAIRKALRSRKTIAIKALKMIAATALEIELDPVEWSLIEDKGRELAISARNVRDIPTLSDLVDRLESMRADAEAHFQTQLQMQEHEIENINNAPEGAKTCAPNTTTTDLSINKLNKVVKTEKQVGQKLGSRGGNQATQEVPAKCDTEDPIESTLIKYKVSPKMVAGLSPFFKSLIPVKEPLDWKTIGDTGSIAFKMTGIAEHAWNKAVKSLGREVATLLVIIVMCKRKELRSPGGYFSAMVQKGLSGELHLGPTLYGLRDKAQTEAAAALNH